MNDENTSDESLPAEPDSKSDSGAKWFVIAFLLIVPALGFTLVGAIAWAVWKAMFAH